MSDISEIVSLVKSQGEDWNAHKKSMTDRLDLIESEVTEVLLKAQRPGSAGGASGHEIKHLQTADGRKLPMLRSDQKAADLYRGEKSEFNLGEFCRDAVCGSTKAASGPALVPTYVGSQIIDLVRAQTVISQAGASTIIIDGPTNLARLTTDPTVYQHTEAATDIVESDIIATPVALNPKVLAVLVPLTVELVQDSPNLDQLLNVALAGAFGAKLDALCIATLLADANIPKSAAGQDPAFWAKVLVAVGAALAANQALPSAYISAPADFIARASEIAVSAGNWMGKPPALAAMQELHTTGLTAGTALFGDFAAAFAIAMRSQLRVEVVRHAKPTSGSHLLVAHMRADGIVLQAARLFKQLKTVV